MFHDEIKLIAHYHENIRLKMSRVRDWCESVDKKYGDGIKNKLDQIDDIIVSINEILDEYYKQVNKEE